MLDPTYHNITQPNTQQDLKGEVQTLARVLDGNSSSLASLTVDSLADVNRLADQAARCKSAIGALDGLCQVGEVGVNCTELRERARR